MVRGANSGLFQSHPAIGMRENNSSRAHGFSLSLFEFQLQAECFAIGTDDIQLFVIVLNIFSDSRF